MIDKNKELLLFKNQLQQELDDCHIKKLELSIKHNIDCNLSDLDLRNDSFVGYAYAAAIWFFFMGFVCVSFTIDV
jgi:hypothetical protein